MKHNTENELQLKQEIQNVLNYFVKEGMVEEVSQGEFVLTPAGREVTEIPF